jgi:hypothetical protein
MQVWLAKVLKDSVEFLKWNEESILPKDLRITQFDMAQSCEWVTIQSFLILKSNWWFRNYGNKVHATFWGGGLKDTPHSLMYGMH